MLVVIIDTKSAQRAGSSAGSYEVKMIVAIAGKGEHR